MTPDAITAYVNKHDIENILSRATTACVHANAADPIGFIIDHLKAVKEAAASNATVADKKEEATTAVVPAVTSEFDGALSVRWCRATSQRSSALARALM